MRMRYCTFHLYCSVYNGAWIVQPQIIQKLWSLHILIFVPHKILHMCQLFFNLYCSVSLYVGNSELWIIPPQIIRQLFSKLQQFDFGPFVSLFIKLYTDYSLTWLNQHFLLIPSQFPCGIIHVALLSSIIKARWLWHGILLSR